MEIQSGKISRTLVVSALVFSLLLSGSAAAGNFTAAEAAVRNVTVSAVSQSGAALGMWATVQSGGSTVKTGFTPLTFAADTTKSYTVTVYDYNKITFDRWGDGGSSRTRTITAQDTHLVAYYNTGSPPPAYSLTVRSADLAGKAFSGMWATVQSGGSTVKSGFTPLSHTGAGGTYTVTAFDYQDTTFDHWENGSTSRTRTVSLSADTVVTAYYKTKPVVQTYSLTVRSAALNGTELSGMWTTVQTPGSPAMTGFTAMTRTVTSDKSYTVTVDDYRDIVFDHWENGSTSRSRTFTPGASTVMTAYYKTATLALSPASGVAGTTVTASGANFAPSSPVTITYDGQVVANGVLTNAAGSFTAPFAVPSTAAGKHMVQAVAGNGWKASASFTDSTAPALSVAPSSGVAGDTVVVSGTGFSASSPVTVKYGGTVVIADAATSAAGAFSASFAVPYSSPGSHVVEAADANGWTATAAFEDVTASSITVSPSSGTAGTPVSVSGMNFPPSSPVAITYDGQAVASATAGPDGSFTASFAVPSTAAGAHAVGAEGGSGLNASATFTDTTAPVLSLTPQSGIAGDLLTVSGAGFSASSPVTVTYGGAGAVASATTDAAGSFSASFAAPYTAAGSHVVEAADANGWKASAAFTDTTTPSISVTPQSGPGGSATVTVTGMHFAPSSEIAVSYDSVAVASATTDAAGSFSASFAVPETSAGAHTVGASGGAGQQSATATFVDTKSYHPLAKILHKTGVYVPLFMYPGGSGFANHWQKVIDAKNAHPDVPIVVTVNPSSGPGSFKDNNFVNGINKLKAAGIVVLGYTYDSYGSRSMSAVKADVDKYRNWYGVDGIFLDEVSNKVGLEARYQEIDAYTDAAGMKMTMGNPGTDVPQSYMGTLDTFSITEGSGYAPMSWLRYCIGCTTSGWHDDYDKRNFLYIRYGVSTLDTAYVTESAQWVGLVYLTNDTLSNPWDTVASYLDALVATLDT